MRGIGPQNIVWTPSSPLAEVARYALAATIVAGLAGGAMLAMRQHRDDGPVASETDAAVLIDLPPALASSAPASEVNEGPQQQAAEAVAPVAPTAPPEEVADPKTDDPPLPKQDEPLPPDPKVEAPTPPRPAEPVVPVAPDPASPMPAPTSMPPPPEPPPPEPPPPIAPAEEPKPPPPVDKQPVVPPPPAAAATAQEELAPAGSQAPVKDAEPLDSEAARRRAAHAISRWQQAMLVRLEGAKGGAQSGGRTGIVTVAFAIDRRGHLSRCRVARGSGLPELDREALALLARAAPFPAPPASADEAGLSFTVPIVFARRR